jgi:hypothetical protein
VNHKETQEAQEAQEAQKLKGSKTRFSFLLSSLSLCFLCLFVA